MADERTVSVVTWINSPLRNQQKVDTIFSFAQIRGWYRDQDKQKAMADGTAKVSSPIFSSGFFSCLLRRAGQHGPHPKSNSTISSATFTRMMKMTRTSRMMTRWTLTTKSTPFTEHRTDPQLLQRIGSICRARYLLQAVHWIWSPGKWIWIPSSWRTCWRRHRFPSAWVQTGPKLCMRLRKTLKIAMRRCRLSSERGRSLFSCSLVMDWVVLVYLRDLQ